MNREEAKLRLEECHQDMSEWLGKEIGKCSDCPYCYECGELAWQQVEAHRQPNGRFGKIYED